MSVSICVTITIAQNHTCHDLKPTSGLHACWKKNAAPAVRNNMKFYKETGILLCIFILLPTLALGMKQFCLETGREVYGYTEQRRLFSRTTLLDIARQNDLGFNQITAANPGIDPWVPYDGAGIIIPGTVILPEIRLAEGMVVNLAEMRLFFFTSSEYCNGVVYTCPVGTGKSGYSTRPGIYSIYQKKENPAWIPPPSVRAEDPDMPHYVPPGPENPLGRYVLRFSRHAYGIHGTNRPWGIGRRVSHGCIRLYPEDIQELFGMVETGSLVRVVYEPVKAGYDNGKCWLQVFDDFEHRVNDIQALAFEKLAGCSERIRRERGWEMKFDMNLIRKTVEEKRGIAVPVGKVIVESVTAEDP